MKKVIYLDNAATTKVRPEVVEAMLPFYTEYYGNPSAVYEFSTPCKEALAKARETVANALGAKDNEIYFTNGGSESDNWALKATAEAYKSKGKHIITTKIEHHAILHTCEWLEKHGYEITYLPVDENGVVKIDELKKVKFSKRSNKAAQGDKSLTVDVDMMIVGGVYQDGVAPV